MLGHVDVSPRIPLRDFGERSGVASRRMAKIVRAAPQQINVNAQFFYCLRFNMDGDGDGDVVCVRQVV